MLHIRDDFPGRATRQDRARSRLPLPAVAVIILVALLSSGGCSLWSVRVPPGPCPIPTSEALQRAGLVAHRCGGGEAPENTIAAAEHCLRQDVAWIEIDVRTSRDGVLVLVHDDSLGRTTDCDGPVRHWRAAELADCDAGRYFSEKYAGESIPSLEEMLLWAKGRIGVYLDVKDADPAAVAALVRRSGMAGQCLFGFDGWDEAAAFAEMAPDLALKQSVISVEEIARAGDELVAQVVEIQPKHLSAELVQACRDRNLLMMIPIFGRNDDAYRTVLSWAPDLINLDHPARFRKVAARLETAARVEAGGES